MSGLGTPLTRVIPLPQLWLLRYALTPIAWQAAICRKHGEQQGWRVLRVFGWRVALFQVFNW